jgi:aminobenzoyl-glutamate transport protein
MKVARASYLAGFAGTSNVLAGKNYGIPIVGTMAHSFVSSFEREVDAFRAFVASFPDNSILLIDTYDTLAGARNAVQVAQEMAARGQRLRGVRIDSGDLASLARAVRQIFDAAGFTDVKIIGSGGLDEYELAELSRVNAPYDSYGVGTKMGVSADAPWLDIAYKLVEHDGRPILKLSTGKVSSPGRKQVFRFVDDQRRFKRDLIALRSEAFEGGEPLLKKVMEQGKILGACPSADEIRSRCQIHPRSRSLHSRDQHRASPTAGEGRAPTRRESLIRDSPNGSFQILDPNPPRTPTRGCHFASALEYLRSGSSWTEMRDSREDRGCAKRKFFSRVLDVIERAGNRLPHPLILFALLAGLVLIASGLAAALGIGATHPVTGKKIAVVNLLDRQGIQNIITKAVTNFTGFAPLGTVLVAMIGVGLAERSGFFATALKGFVAAVPAWLITTALVFAGVNASLAVDAGYVILVPLGALLFAQIGRNPIAGLAAAFAGVSGGFSANIFLTPLDPLLAGLTQEAARLYDPRYTVPVTANYYFMIASTFMLTFTGAWVSNRVIEPRLGAYSNRQTPSTTTLAADERRGLVAAAGTLTVAIIALLSVTVPENGLLRGAKGSLEPFFQGMVTLMAIGFLLLGMAYGIGAGTIKSNKDVGRMIEETMCTMGSYIALAFAASQFVAYFAWSNLGLILAISGADLLRATGISGIPLVILFIFVCAVMDLFLASASAKWAVTGTVFVPMLMIMGYSPELTQAAYRIGDSFTNIVTPLMPYMPLIIAFARKYDPGFGLGTLLSVMLPYSIAFAFVWTLLLVLWLLLGIPLGPGASTLYSPA